jgi:phospho-N-acetylmuramoyl-pentapeptide-transferase
MGGVLIIFAVVVSTLLWANLSINYVWLILLVTLGYGLIGFIDDYSKLAGKSSKGIPGKTRLVAEIIIALFVSIVLFLKLGYIYKALLSNQS